MHLTLLFQLWYLIFTEPISWHQLVKKHLADGGLGPVVLHPHESVEGPLPYLPLPLVVLDLLDVVLLQAVPPAGQTHYLGLSLLVGRVLQPWVFRVC